MRKEKGITLVALIVTIIILLILSAVTIKSIVDMQIIKLTAEAGEKYAKEQDKEIGLMNGIANIVGGIANNDKEEPKDLGIIEGAIEFGELKWENKKASVIVTKTVKEDYKIEYEVENEAGDIIREYEQIESGGTIGELNLGDTIYARLTDGNKHTLNTASITVDDKEKPEIKITVQEITNNSIKISITAEDKEAGMPEKPIYKYYIKQGKTAEYPKDPIKTETSTEYTYTNLTPNISYDIKIETEDIAKNTGISENKNIVTKENLSKPNIKVASANGTSRKVEGIDYYNKENGNLTATITDTASNTSATKLSYKITDKNGNTKTGEGAVQGISITEKDYGFTIDGTYKIEAWSEDKNGNKSEIAEVNFGCDINAPTITNASSDGTSETTADVTASGSDGTGTGIATYKFYIGNNLNTSKAGTTSATGTITGLTTGDTNACYISAVDKAGNEGEK